MMERFRPLPFQGLSNTRDLGGLPGAGGKALRPGLLLRSGQLSDATREDLALLSRRYSLGLVADLRSPSEKTADPDPLLPGAKHLELEVLDDGAVGISRSKAGLESLYDLMRSESFSGLSYFTPFYRLLISGKAAREGYARLFRELLALPEGKGALWHCTAGKDRTGVATLLLLLALGTPREVMRQEYLSYHHYQKSHIDSLAQRLGRGDPHLEDNLRTLYDVEPAYLEEAFAQMTALAGSPEDFPEKGLGLTKAEIAALRAKYLEP